MVTFGASVEFARILSENTIIKEQFNNLCEKYEKNQNDESVDGGHSIDLTCQGEMDIIIKQLSKDELKKLWKEYWIYLLIIIRVKKLKTKR